MQPLKMDHVTMPSRICVGTVIGLDFITSLSPLTVPEASACF